jgi:dolichol-phosphate mannosyltransferase
MDVSIILPCYNEIDNIGCIIDDIIRVCSPERHIEIIVVDDNSPDGTASFVKKRYPVNSPVKLIVRKKCRGLAFSIREGIEAAKGTIILVMDADYNHDPHYLPIFCKIIECPNVDAVLGSRFIFGGASTDKYRYFLSRTYNLFINYILSGQLTDNLSGFFAIKKEKLSFLNFDKIFWGYGDYYLRLLFQMQRLNFFLIQVPIRYRERKSGLSKTKFLQIFLRYTGEVFRAFYYKTTGRF